MAPHTINVTAHTDNLEKNHNVKLTPANSLPVITYATNNNVIKYRCRQLVELVFNIFTIHQQTTPLLVDTAINEPL